MKYLSIILSALIACGGSEKAAFAGDFIPVHLYLLKKSDALTACQVMEAWDYAKARYDRAGIRVEAVSLTEIEHADLENVELRVPQHQYPRLQAFIKYLNKSGGYKAWEAYYLYLPPLDCSGMRCYGGIARNICGISSGAISVGQGGAWSSHEPPRERIGASGLVTAHEIGHTVGASHHSTIDVGDKDDYPPNIMDLAAGRFYDTVPGGLWFLDISIQEMRDCLGISRSKSLRACRSKFRGKPGKRRKCIKRIKRRAPVMRSGGMTDGDLLLY